MHRGRLTELYEAIVAAKVSLADRIEAWTKTFDPPEEAAIQKEVVKQVMHTVKGANPKIVFELVQMEITSQC